MSASDRPLTSIPSRPGRPPSGPVAAVGHRPVHTDDAQQVNSVQDAAAVAS
jgi:hypothetical protein